MRRNLKAESNDDPIQGIFLVFIRRHQFIELNHLNPAEERHDLPYVDVDNV